jgi:Uma2 family endonuclease
MGYAQKSIAYILPDEYLALEERASTKHEYLNGVIYAWQGREAQSKAGGTVAHNKAALNVAISLRQQLKGKPCTVLMSDVRLHLEKSSAYFYPDVMLTCSGADQTRNDAVAQPCLVVEVLSDSTEFFDRGDRFAAYQTLPSLQAYLLVSLERKTLELFTRANDWQAETASTARVSLGLMDLVLSADEVFERV